MKKIVVIVLVLVMTVGLSATALADGMDILIAPKPEASVNDVAEGTWYTDSVKWAVSEGIITAKDGKFLPNEITTRADLFDVLHRYAVKLGLDVSEGEDTNILSYEDAFDIPEGYAAAFQWACAASLAGGETPYLEPNKILSRQDTVKILYDFAVWAGLDVSVGEDTNILSFNDVFEVTEGNFAALQWACGAGVIIGTGADALSPLAETSRAQLAVMLSRFDKLI